MPALDATTDLFRLLSEPSRLRLLALLAQDEFTVAELTEATRLAQSRVSSHLARLKEGGLVRDRRSGNSTYYALNETGMPDEARRLWEILQEDTQDPILEQDARRARELLRVRQGGGTWADLVAGRMDRHYSPGRGWVSWVRGLLGLCELGEVLDVASGDGMIAELLAPRARTITCVDVSEKVVAAGQKRLAHLENVRFEQGDMHSLPWTGPTFDQVLLLSALSYTENPGVVLGEVARVLKPGGRAVIVALNRHNHRDAVTPYNHQNLGFTPDELRTLLERAGFVVEFAGVTSREKRPPHFEILTAYAHLQA